MHGSAKILGAYTHMDEHALTLTCGQGEPVDRSDSGVFVVTKHHLRERQAQPAVLGQRFHDGG